jgi:hypothetical protein
MRFLVGRPTPVPRHRAAYAGADVRRPHDLPRDHASLVGMEPYVRNYALRVHAVRP